MLIIYHSADLDGICSGAILHNKYPGARLLGYDYDKLFDVNSSIEPGEPVIMADVSMSMPIMHEIALRSGDFTWIDHHVSAYNDFIKSPLFDPISAPLGFRYVYLPSFSACEIVWGHEFPDTEMPEPIELLGKYDTWRGNGTPEWDERILPFQYGMRVQGFTPEALSEWIFAKHCFTGSKVSAVIRSGIAILKYQKQQDERLMLKSFDARLNVPVGEKAYRCLVCNGANSSTAFESKWDESKYDIMAGISYDGKMWGVALRTTKDIDLSVIAKSFGGGGHKKAAGCGVDDLRKIFVW